MIIFDLAWIVISLVAIVSIAAYIAFGDPLA